MSMEPTMYGPAIMPMPTGRRDTTIRTARFQHTTDGPESQTILSTGGIFLSARTRSLHALLWACGASLGGPVPLPARFAWCMVEDMFPLSSTSFCRCGKGASYAWLPDRTSTVEVKLRVTTSVSTLNAMRWLCGVVVFERHRSNQKGVGVSSCPSLL